MADEKSDLIQVTGLWLNESNSGTKYFSGSFGGAKVLIFKNGFKDSDNSPDYIMYLGKKQKREEESTTQQESQPPMPTDEIPF